MIVTGPDDIGRLVRQRRRDLGLTQSELASQVDVTRQWLSRFEQGRADVSLEKALRLLRALDLVIDIADLRARAAARTIQIPTIDLSRMTIPEIRVPSLTPAVIEAMQRAVAQSVDRDAIRRSLAAIAGSADIASSLRRTSERNSAALIEAAKAIRARAVQDPLRSSDNDG